MRRFLFAVAILGVALAAFAASLPAQTTPYDHIHLNVPDTQAGADWYGKFIGGKHIPEATDRLMFGSTRLLFLKKDDAKPSAGSVIDHVAFSFADIDAKVKEFQAAGIKIVTPAANVKNFYRTAMAEDPWGTRIELVQDPSRLGLHHVHLSAPNPDEVFSWLQAKFGGQRSKLKGGTEVIKYGAPGFVDMWILVQRGESEASEGRAIDHIGWRSTGSLTAKIDGLRGMGVKILTEPQPLQLHNGTTIHYSYVLGPDGTKIELVERPGLKPGE